MPGGQVVDVAAVLDRWEAAIGTRFAAEVRESYAEAESDPPTLWVCPLCRFGAFRPAMVGTAGFYAAIEVGNYYTDDKWEFERAIRELARREARDILDLGCGSGHFLRRARAALPHVRLTGSELNGAFLDALRRDGFEVLDGDAIQEDGLRGRFDAICLFQVLEHVGDPVALLTLVRDLLAPGGILVVSTPDAEGPIRHFSDAPTEVPPHHVTRWNETAYRELLGRLGFEVRAVEREPLPLLIWDSYLPAQWGDGIWPARLAAAICPADASQEERVRFASQCLRDLGLARLHGVPSHTILVVARRRS